VEIPRNSFILKNQGPAYHFLCAGRLGCTFGDKDSQGIQGDTAELAEHADLGAA
jgi:hypothetical protein